VLILSLHKTSPGSIFAGDFVLWSNSPQQQKRHLRACQKVQVSQDQEEKRVRWMCVCEKRIIISVISIPGDFPFFFKKKENTTLFLLSSSCLFTLERVIFSFPVFLLYKHSFFFLALREEEEKKLHSRK